MDRPTSTTTTYERQNQNGKQVHHPQAAMIPMLHSILQFYNINTIFIGLSYSIVVSKNPKQAHQLPSKEGGVAWSPCFTQFTRTAFFLLWKQLQWWMLPVCQWGERAKVTFMPGKKNCGSHTSVFKLWGVKVCLIWYTCQPKCFSRSALKCPPTHKITISGFSQRPIIPQDPNS